MNLETFTDAAKTSVLSAQDLLAGSRVIHEIQIPPAILRPQPHAPAEVPSGMVRIRPLNLATMTLISRATRDNASLVPMLTIKEAVVDPALTVEQIQQMHIGLVHYLVSQINLVSGLGADGEALDSTLHSSLGQAHFLLAKHFGWTPEQVSQLTPGQVAVYLAGIEKLLEWDTQNRGES